jgi:hypothetical protein
VKNFMLALFGPRSRALEKSKAWMMNFIGPVGACCALKTFFRTGDQTFFDACQNFLDEKIPPIKTSFMYPPPMQNV